MVTVYASSSAALRPVYYDAARRMGEVLAGAGKSIIYGAGGGGLMGSMADGALSRNGKVYGVVPGFLQDLELTHRGLTRLTVVEEMRVRKQMMLEDSDAVVTLPGGSGTYELQFLRHSIDECFMGSSHLKMWTVVDEPEQVLEAIENSHAWDGEALQFANVTPANA